MADIQSLSTADSTNTARFPEGQAPSTVNDGARALEGMIARWHRDINSSLSISGAANAWAVTMNRSISASVSALYQGLSVRFRVNNDVSGATTFALNGITAEPVRKQFNLPLEAGDVKAGQVAEVVWDAANTVWHLVAPVTSPLARGHISGLGLSISASVEVKISTGKCRSSNDDQTLPLTTVLGKKINSTWTVGDGNGGRDSGYAALSANEWFSVWLMAKKEGAAITLDAIMNKSHSTLSLTGSYSYARRLGAVRVNAAGDGLLGMIQDGDTFLWKVPKADKYDSSMSGSTSSTLLTLATPPGVITTALVNVMGFVGGQSVGVHLSPPDVGAQSLTASLSSGAAGTLPGLWYDHHDNSISMAMVQMFRVRTDTSSRVVIQAIESHITGASNARATVQTVGWIDTRGRLD